MVFNYTCGVPIHFTITSGFHYQQCIVSVPKVVSHTNSHMWSKLINDNVHRTNTCGNYIPYITYIDDTYNYL